MSKSSKYQIKGHTIDTSICPCCHKSYYWYKYMPMLSQVILLIQVYAHVVTKNIIPYINTIVITLD